MAFWSTERRRSLIARPGHRIYVAYFDRSLPRSIRRVPLSLAVEAPWLEELKHACVKLGYTQSENTARHPAVWWMDQGSVIVESVSKSTATKAIAAQLNAIRSARSH